MILVWLLDLKFLSEEASKKEELRIRHTEIAPAARLARVCHV
jgi:hypothetical protein